MEMLIIENKAEMVVCLYPSPLSGLPCCLLLLLTEVIALAKLICLEMSLEDVVPPLCLLRSVFPLPHNHV